MMTIVWSMKKIYTAVFLGISLFALAGLTIPLTIPQAEAHRGLYDTVCVSVGKDGSGIRCSSFPQAGDDMFLINKKIHLHVTVLNVIDDQVTIVCEHVVDGLPCTKNVVILTVL